jgi:hypothetical protein
MEEVREELHRIIEECNYNLQDVRVIQKSQELDKLLNNHDK